MTAPNYSVDIEPYFTDEFFNATIMREKLEFYAINVSQVGVKLLFMNFVFVNICMRRILPSPVKTIDHINNMSYVLFFCSEVGKVLVKDNMTHN